MRNQICSVIYVVLGHLFVFIGFIGIFLPLLPTTPFVLVACFCYERGSPKFHALLVQNRYFGPSIQKWKEHGSIPLRVKVIAVTMIATSFGWIIASAPLMVIKVLVGLVGVTVSLYIVTRPTNTK